jgi:hypothetical protein
MPLPIDQSSRFIITIVMTSPKASQQKKWDEISIFKHWSWMVLSEVQSTTNYVSFDKL